jgi:hypothetical protein
MTKGKGRRAKAVNDKGQMLKAKRVGTERAPAIAEVLCAVELYR